MVLGLQEKMSQNDCRRECQVEDWQKGKRECPAKKTRNERRVVFRSLRRTLNRGGSGTSENTDMISRVTELGAKEVQTRIRLGRNFKLNRVIYKMVSARDVREGGGCKKDRGNRKSLINDGEGRRSRKKGEERSVKR